MQIKPKILQGKPKMTYITRVKNTINPKQNIIHVRIVTKICLLTQFLYYKSNVGS